MPTSTLYQAQYPKATLLIVHGMTEHKAMYAEFARFLTSHGITVMTFDHLGHGQKAFDNQSLGYMGNPNPAANMIENVMGYANQLQASFPAIPHFILGHSMGSFIVRCIIQRYGNRFAGAIIIGTSGVNPLTDIFLPVTKLLNHYRPTQQNFRLDLLLGKVNNVPFRHEANAFYLNWLNSNPERINDYIDDPLFGFSFTNNGFYALMTLMQQGTNKGWWRKVPKDLPLLFISGKDDPVGHMGRDIPQIVKSLQHHDFTKVSAKLYDGMRHQVLSETNYQQVYDDILEWLLDCIEAINLAE